MPKETERKFLVDDKKWLALEKPPGSLYRQGYLLTDPNKTIRIRVTPGSGFITIKGLTVGATRLEYEYNIPENEATELLDNFSVAELSKVRYKIYVAGKIWEVDEFLKDNEGLIIAEIELQDEAEEFVLPPWILKEVTGDERYYNSNLTIRPFKHWAYNVASAPDSD